MEELPPHPTAGYESSIVTVSFHISRASAFYFYKAQLPMYMLSALATCTFDAPADDTSHRDSMVATYFLAMFALLYVVSEALPKTTYLTRLDLLVIVNLAMLCAMGLFSRVLNYIIKSGDRGLEEAEQLNKQFELYFIVAYVAAAVTLMLPPWLAQRHNRGVLSVKATLLDGSTYVPLEALQMHDLY